MEQPLPTLPAPKTKRADRRREQIIQSAVELFDRQGYANTSLDDIARAVGITREGIYYYFKNRGEILLTIMRPQSEDLLGSLSTILGSEMPAREKLAAGIRNHLERFDFHCKEMTISLRDVFLHDEEEVRTEMKRVWKDYERMWLDLIGQGQAEGVFVAGANRKLIAFGILGMCNWVARWYNPRKPISVEEIIRTFTDMIAFGIVADGDREADWFKEAVTSKSGGPGKATRRTPRKP
jgi:AcrR family transcriptional regulator